MRTLVFEANDTLFFKEARPMETVGAKPLDGRFPPPARTLAGALRSIVGEAMKVDWAAYRDGKAADVAAVIGDAQATDMGQLSLRGPFPLRDGQRLYPAPLSLLRTRDGGYVHLRPGSTPVLCDLGKVYLPELAKPAQGAKPLENAWLTRDDLLAVLAGAAPSQPIPAQDLFAAEPRLGIALESGLRSAAEGLLYQTVHARLQENIAIGIGVDGVPELESIQNDFGFVRLGGEGRFAGVRWQQAIPDLPVPAAPPGTKGIALVLLTPARFEEGCWQPPGFEADTDATGASVWRCTDLHGVALAIRAAALGKPVREGGWDLANHRSRPAQVLLPAGSVFFCTVEGDPAQAAARLQGRHIGLDQNLGRGEIAVGYWQ